MSSDLSETINRVLSDERDVREATAPHQAEFPYDRDEEARSPAVSLQFSVSNLEDALLLSARGSRENRFMTTSCISRFAPMNIEGASELQPGNSLNFFIRTKTTRRS